MIQLIQPAQRARLSLFAPSLPEVMVARLSCRHWSIGRWLLGKSACERKGWGRQSRGRDSVLTSGTCRNRYIYGWRLCTVTDFSMTIRTKEWVTSSVQQLCFTMKFHACRNTQSYILCILSHLKKNPDYFLKQGNNYTRKILKLYRQLYLPFHA